MDFPYFSANLGNIASASEVSSIPDLRWRCDRDTYYTLLMVDPNPMGRDNELGSEDQLWRVGNIKGCDVNKGQTLTDFIPPWPIDGSGLHIYYILIYQQKDEIFFEETFLRNV